MYTPAPTPATGSTTATLRKYGPIAAAAIILVSANLSQAADPPRDLARRAAERESAGEALRAQFAYRQKVRIEEFDGKGVRAGEYLESREVIFTAPGQPVDRTVGKPTNTLSRLRLTEEDFADLRQIQPLLLTKEMLWRYRTVYRGEEKVFDTPCWVLAVEPRQILEGQRLFEGLLWISQADFSVVQSEGRAVPQILGTKQENLFPRFRTFRRPLFEGHWFPVLTLADDTLPFRSGPLRMKMRIEYLDYRRFGSESIIRFDLPAELEDRKP